MNNLLHFGKVFGICWAAAMVAYLFVTFRWGFAVGWLRTPHPPTRTIQIMFWLWPVVPALLIAGFCEIVGIVGLRIAR
jgi:hypothetical protein